MYVCLTNILYLVDLDRYFVVLRNAARDERIEALCRLHLLEIIELRASGWKGNENLDNYCRHKLSESDVWVFKYMTCVSYRNNV